MPVQRPSQVQAYGAHKLLTNVPVQRQDKTENDQACVDPALHNHIGSAFIRLDMSNISPYIESTFFFKENSIGTGNSSEHWKFSYT